MAGSGCTWRSKALPGHFLSPCNKDLTCNMPAACRERVYVMKGKVALDERFYAPDDSGLLAYLGDLCKRGRHQWSEFMMLVSSLLWPALHYKASGVVFYAGVHL